jgi:G3E family GTPase
MRIPVTVVTGFLGAGKSTLVERWLTELPRDETAVIVNEVGEVGIDGALLRARAARLREITGGCVCCATQVELAAALAELAATQPAPSRILVETSGAASPAGVVRPLTRGRAADRLRLDGIVTVVDATRAERALAHDLAIEQLGFADVVVLSHLDRFEGELGPLEARIIRHAPGAVIAHSRRGRIGADAPQTLSALLDARAEVLRVLPEGGAASHPIEAVSLTVDGALDEDRFGDWVEAELGAIEARLLRVKGILAIEGVDARVILQGVGESIEVTLGAPWGEAPRKSRLVIIGLDFDAAALEAGFRACALGACTRADPPP